MPTKYSLDFLRPIIASEAFEVVDGLAELPGGHVCWRSYDGFNFAGWRCRCGAHQSPFATASRRIAIHQVSLLSHTATVARRLRIDVHNNNDSNDNA